MPRNNMRDLSFATFNLFNLQIPGGLTYSTTPPFEDSKEGRKAYENKVSWTAERIKLLDAEIIGFQELWAREALVDVFNQANLANDYDLIARDAPGMGRPQVALAVRKNRKGKSQIRPGADWIANFPDSFRFDKLHETDGAEEEITVTINNFSRPILHAVVQSEGTRPKPPAVSIYVAHLKSKGPARLSFAHPRPVALQKYAKISKSAVSHIRRVMEAGALRALLDGVMKSEDDDDISPTVLLGDLNDDTLAVTNELISDQPTYRVIEK
ncbi:MAG: hypothetical protein AAGA73_13330, partial [Pseudomonadota bacterium]